MWRGTFALIGFFLFFLSQACRHEPWIVEVPEVDQALVERELPILIERAEAAEIESAWDLFPLTLGLSEDVLRWAGAQFRNGRGEILEQMEPTLFDKIRRAADDRNSPTYRPNSITPQGCIFIHRPSNFSLHSDPSALPSHLLEPISSRFEDLQAKGDAENCEEIDDQELRSFCFAKKLRRSSQWAENHSIMVRMQEIEKRTDDQPSINHFSFSLWMAHDENWVVVDPTLFDGVEPYAVDDWLEKFTDATLFACNYPKQFKVPGGQAKRRRTLFGI